MASVQDFETLLKEVVGGKRLSSSKVKELTEIGMKNMTNDTQLVSIIFRTHKSISQASKVSSFYFIDSLTRAARSYANKKNLVGDLNSSKGNAASFLLKLAGVLDSIVQDMLNDGPSEAKAKIQKILDIWTKANTFPPDVLNRLSEMLQDNNQESNQNTANAPSETRPNETPLTTSSQFAGGAQAAPAADVQNALMALLQSQSAGAGQTAPNTTGQLDANQLALLQQLAAQVSLGSPAPATSMPPPPHSPTVVTDPRRPPPLTADSFRSTASTDPRRPPPLPEADSFRSIASRNEYRRDRFSPPSDPRRNGRGGHSGYSGRDYENQRLHRGDKDRSRSPPGRRDPRRPYSPPERPSYPRASSSTDPNEPDTDEFGRTIPSPSNSTFVHTSQTETSNVKGPETVTAPAPQETQTANAVGLDGFDYTTFNAMNPSSWEGLGKAWMVTRGSPPTQEQLMQFVMSGGQNLPIQAPAAPPHTTPTVQPVLHKIQTYEESMASDTANRGMARGKGRVMNQSRPSQERGAYDYRAYAGGGYDTDAVILGGVGGEGGDVANTMPIPTYNPGPANAVQNAVPNEPALSNTRSSGGRMIKVGDKWMWQSGS